jgi:hypothetical protein
VIFSDHGFVDHCPYEIQVAFFPRLEMWFQNETIASKLWCNEENVSVILGIFYQSCYLPMTYRETIIRYVNLFHSNLFVHFLLTKLTHTHTHITHYKLQTTNIIFFVDSFLKNFIVFISWDVSTTKTEWFGLK